MNYKGFTIAAFIIFISGLVINLSAAETNHQVENTWIVNEQSGAVKVKLPAQDWKSVESKQNLLAAFSLQTESDSRAVLAHGKDALTVAANSTIEIPAVTVSAQGIFSKVVQGLGSVLYKIDPRSERQFEVHTPYLVSVVKGTTFNIRVTQYDVTVALLEGSLLVNNIDGSDSVLLRPGQIAVQTKEGPDIQVIDSETGVLPITTTTEVVVFNGTLENTLNLSSSVSNATDGVSNLTQGVAGGIGGLTSTVGGGIGDLTSGLSGSLGGGIGDITSGVGGGIGDVTSGLGGSLGGGIGDITGDVGSGLGDITSDLGDVGSIDTTVDDIDDAIDDITGTLGVL